MTKHDQSMTKLIQSAIHSTCLDKPKHPQAAKAGVARPARRGKQTVLLHGFPQHLDVEPTCVRLRRLARAQSVFQSSLQYIRHLTHSENQRCERSRSSDQMKTPTKFPSEFAFFDLIYWRAPLHFRAGMFTCRLKSQDFE